MDENTQVAQRTKKSADILRAELERKKRDLYKIYNPTNVDHQIVLNAKISPEVWTVPAKDEAIVPLYVARKYWKEMTDKIIIEKSDKLIIEENKKRQDKGFNKMDLHTEQYRFERRNLTSLQGKREQIVNILNRGLYREYGIGENGVKTEDKRFEKASFDPGIELDGQQIVANGKSQESIQVQQPAPEPVEQDPVQVQVEPDEDEIKEASVANG